MNLPREVNSCDLGSPKSFHGSIVSCHTVENEDVDLRLLAAINVPGAASLVRESTAVVLLGVLADFFASVKIRCDRPISTVQIQLVSLGSTS